MMPRNVEHALKLIDEAENQQADFIEVRLDLLKRCEKLVDIANSASTPLIATNRPTWCSGKFTGPETERKNMLLHACQSGFEYVDVEVEASWLREAIKQLKESGAKPIVSFHDFEKTPEKAVLQQILEKEISNEADVCKIVTTARSLMDNLTLLSFLWEEKEKAKIVCFAMGPHGKPSRILSPIFGGYFTIAALNRGEETAPGQMTLQEMKTAYKALGEL
ncbi:MAG: type I 3-dehydroquinate dehydratase [Candidatus Bathyarchaeota archaeon]|nr:type I 3-dehydroquinate dehydratase [Candidatus Bathyarchaeota archaeon]